MLPVPQQFRQHGYRAVAFGRIFHNSLPDPASWVEPTNWPQGVGYSRSNLRKLADARQQMRSDGKPVADIDRMRGPATEIQDEPDERNSDGRMTVDAIEKMRELQAEGAPFFLAIGYVRPHLPFIAPRKYWDLYDRAEIPLASNALPPRGSPAVACGDRAQGGTYELRDYLDYADAPSPFERTLTEAQQRELKHGHYASVSFIDAQVGLLLGELERLGLADNTIVVLWGDHGWKLGEHGAWCKQTNSEVDTRAPLILRMPGAAANGREAHGLVEFVDVYPTLCELAALPMPAGLHGRSLAPLPEDAEATVKEAAFSQFPRRHHGRSSMGYAMRTVRHRYIEWIDLASGGAIARELYDHDEDAGEDENIADRVENEALVAAPSAEMCRTLPRPVGEPLPD